MIHYFSNSSEHERWAATRCDICVNDWAQACPIILDMLTGEPHDALTGGVGAWECSQYRGHTQWCATATGRRCDCTPPPPVPIDGQLDMFGNPT